MLFFSAMALRSLRWRLHCSPAVVCDVGQPLFVNRFLQGNFDENICPGVSGVGSLDRRRINEFSIDGWRYSGFRTKGSC